MARRAAARGDWSPAYKRKAGHDSGARDNRQHSLADCHLRKTVPPVADHHHTLSGVQRKLKFVCGIDL